MVADVSVLIMAVDAGVIAAIFEAITLYGVSEVFSVFSFSLYSSFLLAACSERIY